MPKKTHKNPPAFPCSAVVEWQRSHLVVRIYNAPDNPQTFPQVDDANRETLRRILSAVIPSFTKGQLPGACVQPNKNGICFAYPVVGFEADPPSHGNEPDLFKRAAWQALLDAGMTEARR